MRKYPKLKNFWFSLRMERAIVRIKKHYGLTTQAETVRLLIDEEMKRLDGVGNEPR